jgi:predicted PolB exonuclease-like 3'-5' exonuclease
MKAVISEVKFIKKWGDGMKAIHYHDVWFEGVDGKWNIGAKAEMPDFLAPGKTLEYEITDAEKKKIKRLTDQNKNKSTSSWNGGNRKPAPPPVNPDSPSLIAALDNFNESDIIFIDIETVRGVKELKAGSPLYDAWEYKNRYNNELERKTGEKVTLEEYFLEKAALYAVFAKVVAIVVGRIVEGQLKTKKYLVSKDNGWSEGAALKEFNDDVNTILQKNPSTIFSGWANKTFDQPFLAKRMYVNGIKPNRLLDTAHLKPWEIPGFDLKELWQGSAFYPDSLIAVAVALGLQSPKAKMDGSQVGEYYYAGKTAEIGEYCEADVLTSANIYRKLVSKPTLTLYGATSK